MLSVLIPIYNTAVSGLIQKLHSQLENETFPFEILVCDDASPNAETQAQNQILKLPNYRYLINPKNLGRAHTRDRLVQEAQYATLLFLDGDMDIEAGFIQAYVPYLNQSKVVFGGLKTLDDSYKAEHSLRLAYSKAREELSVTQRQRKPYLSAKLCNLLIPKSVFQTPKKALELKSYGHEDTLFMIHLEQIQYPIAHIHNPVIHLGIESNAVFIQKTVEGVQNLYKLQQEHLEFAQTPLVDMALFLKRWGLMHISFWILSRCKSFMTSQIDTAKPSLRWFDAFKLYHYLALELGIKVQ
jgi:glycosyltransferase involved in cell wall biosynthesis